MYLLYYGLSSTFKDLTSVKNDDKFDEQYV